MPQEKFNKSITQPCKNLRSKMYYVPTVTGATEINMEKDDSTAQYWCLKTMQAVGPDDMSVVRTQCCNSFRTCFESREI